MEIGVLALQGAFVEHSRALTQLGATVREVRQCSDLRKHMDGLVLPGGESTVQSRLLHRLELFQPLQELLQQGLPVMGTCAGMILLAQELAGDGNGMGQELSPAPGFRTMDIRVRRNAYGRQLESFSCNNPFGEVGECPMTFIRAPRVECCGEAVHVLAQCNGHPVAVQQQRQLALAFHPELQDDLRIHRYFLEKIVAK